MSHVMCFRKFSAESYTRASETNAAHCILFYMILLYLVKSSNDFLTKYSTASNMKSINQSKHLYSATIRNA